jgi:hypothetical protein
MGYRFVLNCIEHRSNGHGNQTGWDDGCGDRVKQRDQEGQVHYSSKAGLILMFKSLAIEWVS